MFFPKIAELFHVSRQLFPQTELMAPFYHSEYNMAHWVVIVWRWHVCSSRKNLHTLQTCRKPNHFHNMLSALRYLNIFDFCSSQCSSSINPSMIFLSFHWTVDIFAATRLSTIHMRAITVSSTRRCSLHWWQPILQSCCSFIYLCAYCICAGNFGKQK